MNKREKTTTPLRPPRRATTFLRWFLKEELLEEVEGDLEEKFYLNLKNKSVAAAKRNYWYQVFHYLRPFAIKSLSLYPSNNLSMYRSYFKVGLRNLWRNKGFSLINIGGLAVGMAVAILIFLWVQDELNFNTYHQSYDRVVQVMQHKTYNNSIKVTEAMPYPIADELVKQHGDDFEYAVMMDWLNPHIISYEQKRLTKTGSYMDVDAPHLLSLNMLGGDRDGLEQLNSILLSQSLAKSLFGEKDPLGETLKIDNLLEVKVTGVYEDLPFNTRFKDLAFIAPWDLYISSYEWTRADRESPNWDNNSYMCLAQIGDHVDISVLNEKIKDVKYNRVNEQDRVFKPVIFLHPVSDWHLKSSWKEGIQKGGFIQYVWLFGIIGVFVLMLAFINFMNLSTAQAGRRAQEVGIRKSLGSLRGQLVSQFLSESLLVVLLAFTIALLIVAIAMPAFNQLADKRIHFPLWQANFWLLSIGFILLTGLLAGSYPAWYLSAFHPVEVLKGTQTSYKSTSLFRKLLVILQFTVSIILIIGTIGVDQQIQHSKNRAIGYDRDGVIMIEISSSDYTGKYHILKDELQKRGAIENITLSSSPLHEIWNGVGGFKWAGKDPNFNTDFAMVWVTHDYGKTIDWTIQEGRDFSTEFTTDSTAYIINEAAAKYINLENPVDQSIEWYNGDHRIIGVIKDMIMESPFRSVKPTIYAIDDDDRVNWIMLKLNPELHPTQSLSMVESVWKQQVPAVPFEYRFADQTYAEKFEMEERIHRLSFIFALLAIIISCLGLFGLSSFTASQRTKEIGVRKVLGASVFDLWALLTKDFILPVFIACLVAIPIAYFGLANWITNYEYRTDISWWFFAFAIFSAISISILTVSYHSIKPALMNPVNSLKAE